MSNQQRQLTQKEKRSLIQERLKIASELSNKALGGILGVSHNSIQKVRQEMEQAGQIAPLHTLENEWVKHPHLIKNPHLLDNLNERKLRAIKAPGVLDKMQEDRLTSSVYAQRCLNKEKKAVRKNTEVMLSSEDFRIFVSDIRDGLPAVADKSIDLLLLDPPYAREYLPLLSYISGVAARVLKDDGNLLVLFGNAHLPEAINRLSEHLEYHWQLSYLTLSGGSPPLSWLGVATHWKPVLWFRKPKMPYKGDMIYDVVNTGKPNKISEKLHIWEQDLSAISELVTRFCNPGDTVADFMLGSGTTALSAIKAKCRFVGSDISEDCVKITRNRVIELLESINGKNVE